MFTNLQVFVQLLHLSLILSSSSASLRGMEHTNSATVRTPEAAEGSETPVRVVPTHATNGVLRRHAPHLHHNYPHQVVYVYKECLKNFAASLGGHSLDGCGEFLESSTELICQVCGCHRNFHRREIDDFYTLPPPSGGGGGGGGDGGSGSDSPPPLAAYPPHMMMVVNPHPNPVVLPLLGGSSSKKRQRTKFTAEQKAKMQVFASQIGWKMLKKDEVAISQFCKEIAVDRTVFKVWMHNNKVPTGKKEFSAGGGVVIRTPPRAGTSAADVPSTSNGVNLANGAGGGHPDVQMAEAGGDEAGGSGTNGSSSSTC